VELPWQIQFRLLESEIDKNSRLSKGSRETVISKSFSEPSNGIPLGKVFWIWFQIQVLSQINRMYATGSHFNSKEVRKFEVK